MVVGKTRSTVNFTCAIDLDPNLSLLTPDFVTNYRGLLRKLSGKEVNLLKSTKDTEEIIMNSEKLVEQSSEGVMLKY